MEMHLKKKIGNREGLSLCGVKVSGYTMLSQALWCYAPKNPTTLVVGVVSESNEEQALNYCIKNFDRVLSKTVKFNLKESIKLFILDILGLKSFNVSFNIEKGRVENDR